MADSSQTEKDGGASETPALPTRKRQGTWENPGEKRQFTQAIAAERKLSEVDAASAEGHKLPTTPAKEQAQFHHEGDSVGAENGDKNRTVFLLDIFLEQQG